jgi:hypothetical protein
MNHTPSVLPFWFLSHGSWVRDSSDLDGSICRTANRAVTKSPAIHAFAQSKTANLSVLKFVLELQVIDSIR